MRERRASNPCPRSADAVHARRVFNRIFGVKPGPGAPKLDRLLWFRGYYLRNLALMVPLLALMTAFLTSWRWIVIAVAAVSWGLGFTLLNAEISREKRRL